MREGVQYYHRYLAAFHLQRYDLVVRDTERNLRLFAFVVEHATRQRDKLQFDQYRPYVTMMNTRAHSAQALGPRRLLRPPWPGSTPGSRRSAPSSRSMASRDHEAECFELGFLLRLRREVEAERPVGPVERLEQQLGLAVAARGIRGGRADSRPAPATPQRRRSSITDERDGRDRDEASAMWFFGGRRLDRRSVPTSQYPRSGNHRTKTSAMFDTG